MYLRGRMAQFPHDKIKPFKEEIGKKEQVSAMFDAIAFRYDFMNRFLSAGIDIGWRKKAIDLFKKEAPQHLLDVATGTGDMAIMAAKRLHLKKITGIDISPKMLEIGRKKVLKENLSTEIELLSGDSETINFSHDSFDGVMVAFGLRNFENLEKGLQEILRVMKPGALMVALEFSKPRTGPVRWFYQFYMGKIAPQMAKWFHQNKEAYQYLNESAKAFPDQKDFVQILNNVGFSDTSFKPLSLGICCIYCGRKSGPQR
ncbi:MAG: bifunctional demethylmenaquinone methyltransferase/2-methoxy-6-polyprenyl-1,4-benzoquinol methylase UbiE [Chitinophagaceae bacterium]